jgi:septin family protein
MATPAAEEIRASSYVGFDSITRQIERKLLKRGFQFNVIVVGQSLLPPTGRMRCTAADTLLVSPQ